MFAFHLPPIQYDEPLFRPPSEARSAIFQATLGCSFNQCTFCGMYKTKKFKVRPWEIVQEEMIQMAKVNPHIEKVFIADGDALVLPKTYWLNILEHLPKIFHHLRRVSSYATPQNILKKTPEQLSEIRKAGLEMLYMGVESGDPKTLEFVIKGVSREEIIKAGKKAKEAGFKLSCTALLGIAGKKDSKDHAEKTASIFNAIQPDYLGVLIWMPVPGADLRERAKTDFQLIDVMGSLNELREMIAHLELKQTLFRSNHASNYLPLGGTLPNDKENLLAILDQTIQDPENAPLRPEFLRAT